MKPLYAVPVLLLLAGCQASTAPATRTTPAPSSVAASGALASSAAPTPSPSVNTAAAQSACERLNELAYQISGPVTPTQQTELSDDVAALSGTGDPTLTNIVTVNESSSTVSEISSDLAGCVTLGYLANAATITTAAPASTVQTASAGSALGFSNIAVIGPSKSTSFASMDDGLLRPTNGHFVAVVIYAAAAAQFTMTSGDFYVKLPDGSHIDPTFALGMTPAQLTFVTINAGEKANGTLVFDLPVTTGFQLVYAPQNTILGVWLY